VSYGVASGESLFLVGAAVGQSSQQITQRYGHVNLDPIRALATRTGSLLAPVAPKMEPE